MIQNYAKYEWKKDIMIRHYRGLDKMKKINNDFNKPRSEL